MAELKTLIRKRGAIKSRVTAFRNYVDRLKAEVSENAPLNDLAFTELNERVSNIQATLTDFESVQSEIELLTEDDNIENAYAERNDFIDNYLKQVSLAKTILKGNGSNRAEPDALLVNRNNASRNENETENFNLKVPDWTLPKFDGSSEKWSLFYETFKSAIHDNEHVPVIRKFEYLSGALEGKAATVIQGLPMTVLNYPIAWSLLETRYENIQLRVHNHIKNIVEYQTNGKENSSSLRELLDNLQINIRALKALKQPVDHWDSLLIYIYSNKLEPYTRREWEKRSIDKKADPKFSEFTEFLELRCQLLEKTDKVPKTAQDSTQSRNKNTRAQKPNLSHASSAPSSDCAICTGQHRIYECKQFHELTVADRIDEIKKRKRCFNCFRASHLTNQCKSRYRCLKCGKVHHTLLHLEHSNSEKTEPECNQNTGPSAVNHCSTDLPNCHLLPTARVQIEGNCGNIIECTALLDSGSQSNFITAQLCRKLGLKTRQASVPIVGINESSTKIYEQTSTTIKSIHDNSSFQLSLMVIPKITANLPSEPLNISNLNLPPEVTLADPLFCSPKKIDLLIGVDLFWELLSPEPSGHPYLHKTRLGYVVSGNIKAGGVANSIVCNVSIRLQELSHQLQKFWELEECREEPTKTAEEEACETHFVETTKRDANGRFIVSIPFKGDLSLLGDSQNLAEKRFHRLEKHFTSNPKLKEMYVSFMNEYITLGHMHRVDNKPTDSPVHYLPHHGVLKENSSTTKLRVVFDASAKTTTGISLNDLQMVGPTIQSDLFSILVRFREYRFVVGADIAMMYRQILVDATQGKLRRILWRSTPSDPLATYELTTVTYGQASSPFLAIRCLFELAKTVEKQYPKVATLIREAMYVDDFYRSFKTKQEAVADSKQLAKVLSSGGFRLRKWTSNDSKILLELQNTDNSTDPVHLGQDEITKALGLSWSPIQDKLLYQVGANIIPKIDNKRAVLSVISRIFDPLGLLSPCIVIAKLLLQELWELKINWDDSLPDPLMQRWTTYVSELSCLNNLRIERQVCYSEMSNEIHAFSDSSKLACGACVYVRSVDSSGSVTVNLLCSKTKVAPLASKKAKLMTIPRLELCGALISARLINKIRKILSINVRRVVLWCDSTIVLGWLRKEPAQLPQFVGNRVSEIQCSTPSCEWRYIASEDNPADLLSRGVSPGKLGAEQLWWNGPQWLRENETDWPNTKFTIPTLPEVKQHVMLVKQPRFPLIEFKRHSDVNRLERILAWCYRFIANASSEKEKREHGPLRLSEIRQSNIRLARLAQAESFPHELESLSANRSLDAKNRLLKLNPFLHTDGTIRVGGRLNQSDFSFDKRHPIILASDHQFTKLLFRREHVRLFHAGPQALLASTRDTYWTISGRNLARKVVHDCVVCFRHNPKAMEPLMGDVPSDRVTPVPPFQVTGVDYAGPILIKDRKGRGCKISKSYICLFICFVTRAIHLELVTDLTTDAFLLAMRRFASRRGMPSKIVSDNGSNFVGASRELKELGQFLKSNESALHESLTSENFNWSFIPSYSPHFGGLWEAGVKSAKFHLKRVLGNATLTYEELYTVLTQIEAILNSRPLSPLSSNVLDY